MCDVLFWVALYSAVLCHEQIGEFGWMILACSKYAKVL